MPCAYYELDLKFLGSEKTKYPQFLLTYFLLFFINVPGTACRPEARKGEFLLKKKDQFSQEFKQLRVLHSFS